MKKTRPTLMQTETGGRIQLHIGDAENPPPCATGEVRRLAGHDTRDEVVAAAARSSVTGWSVFGLERICRSCIPAVERREFKRIRQALIDG
jgi:hypothetical protein